MYKFRERGEICVGDKVFFVDKDIARCAYVTGYRGDNDITIEGTRSSFAFNLRSYYLAKNWEIVTSTADLKVGDKLLYYGTHREKFDDVTYTVEGINADKIKTTNGSLYCPMCGWVIFREIVETIAKVAPKPTKEKDRLYDFFNTPHREWKQ